MAEHELNPFRYGKPVPPESFVGRKEAVRSVFSRIRNGESSAVVGMPHIGKSSLLRFISNDRISREWLGDTAKQCAFIDIDCHLLPESYQPADFWQHVSTQVEQTFPDAPIRAQSESARQSGFNSFALKSLFDFLGRREARVILLIDEFDTLLSHPQLNTLDFFGTLRSLSTLTESLVLIIASRLSVAEMNRRTQETRPLGSPYFNPFIEVQLLPLLPVEVDELLDRALEGTAITFAPDDRAYIRGVAGRHPYLVQMAAAAVFDAIALGKAGEERYQEAGENLRRTISVHFDDLWRHLSPRAQTAIVVLALCEMKGHLDGRAFDTGGLGTLDWYDPELRQLADLGCVEEGNGSNWQFGVENFATWRGRQWRVSAASFLWWVADNAIAGTRKTIDFEHWLDDRELEGLLTRGEKEKLRDLAGKIPSTMINSAGEFLITLVKGWLTGIGG